MKIKKALIVTLLLLCLLMLGSVSASSDTNDTIVSSDVTSDTISQNTNDNSDLKDKIEKEDSLYELNQKDMNDNDVLSDSEISKTKKTLTNSNLTKTDTENPTIEANIENNKLSSEEEKYSNFTSLNTTITETDNDTVLNLTSDFKYNTKDLDNNLTEIKINKTNFVINGYGHTIDADNHELTFDIHGENITIMNTIFKNGIQFLIDKTINFITQNVTFENCGNDTSRALTMWDSNYISINDTFKDNHGDQYSTFVLQDANLTVINGLFENKNNNLNWGLIYSASGCRINITNTTFANTTSKYSTAIYAANSEIYIKNSKFINLFANMTAGAIGFKGDTTAIIEDCEFINVSSNKNGGAIFIDINAMKGNTTGNIIINNTLFTNCSSEFGGAYLQLGGNLTLINSNFTNNYAEFNGGAIYLSDTTSLIENSIFTSNNVNMTDKEYPRYGGAIFFDNGILDAGYCEFINNNAYQGSGLYLYDSMYSIYNLNFTSNSEPAIYTFFDEYSEIENIKGITINQDDLNNTYYPSLIDGEGMSIVLINTPQNITDIPEYYDLRKLNLTTPVKNQGSMGACWAFGMTASLESAVLKALNITTDFSENNMQNLMLKYSQYGDKNRFEGGLDINGIAYLLSWLGAFPQNHDTYDELGKISPTIRTLEDLHIQDIIIIPNTPLNETYNNISSLNNVKEAIMNYGALAGYILSKASSDDEESVYFNENTSAEYNPNHEEITHAICVVGWNDTYSKDNFVITPPGDGAWIVKNSWGTDWGDEGYFYVSYYDQTLCAFPDEIYECFVAIVINNTLQYNKNYQYDLSGISGFIEADIQYINTFEAIEDDLIAAVGTYFNKEGVNYTIEISVNDNLVYTQNGISPYYGYHTIKLDAYVPIKAGDIFSVLVDSNALPFCSNSRVHYQDTVSMGYKDGELEDLSSQGLVACIKVYTLPSSIKTDNLKITTGEELFIVEVNETNANVTITINNNTITNTTDKDGIVKFNITYLEDGNYTITTTYKDISVINFVEVKNLNRIIEKLEKTINTQNATINKQTEQITTLNNTINKQTTRIQEQNKEISTLNNKLSITTKNVNAKIKKIKATKTVKKSKNYKITVNLNQKVKGKYIYVAFNGKTYKAKTNKDGKVTINIKSSVLKKALGKSKTKTIKYQIISGNSMKNKSVKIKK